MMNRDKEYTFEALPDDTQEGKPDMSASSENSVGSASTGATNDKSPTSKRRTWKKPKDKPKRPLSAYNIFFQHERSRIVEGRTNEEASPEEIVQSIERILSKGREKRRHRKTHGRISFGDLARAIADAWKTINPKDKAIFEHYAEIEMMRYRKDVKAWKDKKEMEQEANALAKHSNFITNTMGNTSFSSIGNASGSAMTISGHGGGGAGGGGGIGDASEHTMMTNMSGHGSFSGIPSNSLSNHNAMFFEGLPDESFSHDGAGGGGMTPATAAAASWNRSRGAMNENFNSSFASIDSNASDFSLSHHDVLLGRGGGGGNTANNNTASGKAGPSSAAAAMSSSSSSDLPMQSIIERQQQILQEQLRENRNNNNNNNNNANLASRSPYNMGGGSGGGFPFAPPLTMSSHHQQQQTPFVIPSSNNNNSSDMMMSMHSSFNSVQSNSLHQSGIMMPTWNNGNPTIEQPLNDTIGQWSNPNFAGGHASINSIQLSDALASNSSHHHRSLSLGNNQNNNNNMNMTMMMMNNPHFMGSAGTGIVSDYSSSAGGTNNSYSTHATISAHNTSGFASNHSRGMGFGGNNNNNNSTSHSSGFHASDGLLPPSSSVGDALQPPQQQQQQQQSQSLFRMGQHHNSDSNIRRLQQQQQQMFGNNNNTNTNTNTNNATFGDLMGGGGSMHNPSNSFGRGAGNMDLDRRSYHR